MMAELLVCANCAKRNARKRGWEKVINEYTIFGHLRFNEPFIYVVKGIHYLIGKNTIRVCTVEEKALYEDFCTLYAKIKDKIPYSWNVSAALSETKELVDATQSIMTLSNSHLTEESNDTVLNELWQLITSCSKEDLTMWDQQIQRYFDALYYLSAYDIDVFIKRRNEQ